MLGQALITADGWPDRHTGEGDQSGGTEGVVGRLAHETQHGGHRDGVSNFTDRLEDLELLGLIRVWVDQNAKGIGDRLALTAAKAEREGLTAKFRKGIDQLRRQACERPSGVGRLKTRHQTLEMFRPGCQGEQPGATTQVMSGRRPRIGASAVRLSFSSRWAVSRFPEAHAAYRSPYQTLVNYLDVLDAEGVPEGRRILAALGPGC